jgi:hypothetical protein
MWTRLSGALFCCVVAVMGLQAQTPPGGVPVPTTADFGDPMDGFGQEMDADGAWAVITGTNGEAYYVYERVGNVWLRRQRIVPPTLGQTGPVSIELEGDRLVFARAFGVPGNDSGRVYIYERASAAAPFVYVSTLAPADTQAGDRFGYGMALSANRLFVGAPGRDEGAVQDQGVVYVFLNSAGVWNQEARLTLPDATAGGAERFGFGLDFDGQDLLIGARQHRPTPGTQGAVYIYRQITGMWTQVQKLEHPGSTAATQFGYDVSAEAGRAVIVAPRTAQRAVFVATRDGGGVWSVAALPDPMAGTGLSGGSYAYPDIEGTTIAFSAFSSGPMMTVTYHFDGSNWLRAALINSTDAEPNAQASVRLAAGFLLVGAPGDDASAKAVEQGSVSSYSLAAGVPTPRQRLWHGAGILPDYLGDDLALDGNWALLLAPGADLAGAGGLDLGTAYFMHRDGGEWFFAQAFGGDPAMGTPSRVALLGGRAFISYPANQTLGLPNPVIQVMQLMIDDSWTPLCQLSFSGASTTTSLGTVLAVSAAGVISDIQLEGASRQMVAFPMPAITCSSGTLLPDPVGDFPQYDPILAMSGNLAALGWSADIGGTFRSGIDVFEFAGGSWSRIDTFVGSSSIGLVSEFYFGPSLDGERISLVHAVPVSTIDLRYDIDVYERIASDFVLQRTFTPSTVTGGFDGARLAGNSIFIQDASIGVNSGIGIYNLASGALSQQIVPAGLSVQDETPTQLRVSGTQAVLTYARQDRDGINNAGMVYSLEYVAMRGGVSSWIIEPMDAAPKPDRMFSDFFEDQAF